MVNYGEQTHVYFRSDSAELRGLMGMNAIAVVLRACYQRILDATLPYGKVNKTNIKTPSGTRCVIMVCIKREKKNVFVCLVEHFVNGITLLLFLNQCYCEISPVQNNSSEF